MNQSEFAQVLKISNPSLLLLPSVRGAGLNILHMLKKKSSEFCSQSHHADFTVKIDKENHVLSQMGGLVPTYSAERNLSFKCLHAFLLTFHLYSYFIYVQKALHSVNRRITDYRLMILKTLPQPFSDEGENEYHIFFYCL